MLYYMQYYIICRQEVYYYDIHDIIICTIICNIILYVYKGFIIMTYMTLLYAGYK